MVERVLVFKSRNGKEKYKIITRNMRGRYSPGDCSMIINLDNWKDVVLFLHDLEDLWNCNVEKAARQYLEDKNTGWPF